MYLLFESEDGLELSICLYVAAKDSDAMGVYCVPLPVKSWTSGGVISVRRPQLVGRYSKSSDFRREQLRLQGPA